MLNDNLSGFSNAYGAILGLLEELLEFILGVFDWGWADEGELGEKYLMILCLRIENWWIRMIIYMWVDSPLYCRKIVIVRHYEPKKKMDKLSSKLTHKISRLC